MGWTEKPAGREAMTDKEASAKKVLITVEGAEVAPRFDLTMVVLVGRPGVEAGFGEDNARVLPQASAEELCHMILTEKVEAVICGGIEEEYHQYLTWKKVEVIDSVMGPWDRAVRRYCEGLLVPGDILFERPERV